MKTFNNPIRRNGYIRWFDSMKGEGVVRLKGGQSVPIHFSQISNFDKNNYAWPSKKDQQRNIKNRDCVLAIYEDEDGIRIRQCRILRTKQNKKRWFWERYYNCPCCEQVIGIKDFGTY